MLSKNCSELALKIKQQCKLTNEVFCRSDDIYDYVYVDTFGNGKQLAAKECENLIRHQVGADYYSAISTSELLLRMVGNLLNIGKRG